jgi:hypothetical protein
MEAATETRPADRYTVKCWKCQGTGRYDAPTSYPGGCFACNGTGLHTRSRKADARREARERKANAQAQATAARAKVVIDRLLAAWGDEFEHIPAEYRHMHVTQKAQCQLRDMGVKVSTVVVDLEPHLNALGV